MTCFINLSDFYHIGYKFYIWYFSVGYILLIIYIGPMHPYHI